MTRELVEFAEKLASIAPGNLRKCFFTNSGSEANETAILAARQYTGRQAVVALRYSYHGRTALTMTMSGHSGWKLGGAQAPGFMHAHNAYCHRCPFKLTYPDCGVQCARDLEELILTETGGDIAAFIAEPIQGVGGFITPPPEYFRIIHEIVRRHGGVFISDEVQTGFGRTGDTWWGIDHYGVTPDIITCAKGVANGAPCGVTITTDDIAGAFTGTTFSTFGGNPVSSVAGLATIEYMERHDLKENARRMGEHLRGRLLHLQQRHSLVGDVRGMGLMQAVELDRPDGAPAPEATAAVLEAARERGLLIGKTGLHNNTLRIAPHLNCTQAEVDCAATILDEAFTAVANRV